METKLKNAGEATGVEQSALNELSTGLNGTWYPRCQKWQRPQLPMSYAPLLKITLRKQKIM